MLTNLFALWLDLFTSSDSACFCRSLCRDLLFTLISEEFASGLCQPCWRWTSLTVVMASFPFLWICFFTSSDSLVEFCSCCLYPFLLLGGTEYHHIPMLFGPFLLFLIHFWMSLNLYFVCFSWFYLFFCSLFVCFLFFFCLFFVLCLVLLFFVCFFVVFLVFSGRCPLSCQCLLFLSFLFDFLIFCFFWCLLSWIIQ